MSNVFVCERVLHCVLISDRWEDDADDDYQVLINSGDGLF